MLGFKIKGQERLANLAGLVMGFGLGQGSLFVVQTWLLTSGRIDFLAKFSFNFTFLILAYQAIDFGGLVILARRVAADDHADHDILTYYWSFSSVRVAIALALATGAIAWSMFDPNSFSSSYAAAASVGLVVFSINPGGLLDGHNKSGWSGATWALPFVASSVALPFCPHLLPGTAGLALGAALSIGGILAVFAQYTVLAWNGIGLPWRRPSAAAMRESGHEGLLYMIGWLPGQLYFRGQIGIAMALLGPVPTALFIYAKQLIMSATRFLYFARRIEYPNLVKQLADGRRLEWKVLTIQKISLWMAVLGMATFAICGIVVDRLFPLKLHGAGLVVALFSPIVLTASFNATFTQACFAVKRTDTNAWISVLIAVIGLGIQAVLTPLIGLTGIMLAEAATHILGVALIVLALRGVIRFRRSRAEQLAAAG